jgi:hypothetical protein
VEGEERRDRWALSSGHCLPDRLWTGLDIQVHPCAAAMFAVSVCSVVLVMGLTLSFGMIDGWRGNL